MLNNLLTKIRHKNQIKLKEEKIPQATDIYNIPQMPLADLFKLELEKVGGKAFIYANFDQLIEGLQQLFSQKHWKKPVTFSPTVKKILQKANLPFFDSYADFMQLDVGLNTCEALVAWTGSVVVSSALPGGRQFNVYSPELIIIAEQSQLFLNIDQALDYLVEKYQNNLPSQISLITGPSKTADIEKTLIYGMHGAKQVYVFISQEPIPV